MIQVIERTRDRIRVYALWLALPAADVAAVLAAIAVALMLRFDHHPWGAIYERFLLGREAALFVALCIYIAAFSALRLYRRAWRFAGMETLYAIAWANTIGIGGLVAAQAVIDGRILPRSVLILTWTICVIVTGGVRLLLRTASVARHNGSHAVPAARRNGCTRRAVILGAGATGARTLSALRENPNLHYNVVGFLDDDPKMKSAYISNVRVLGPIELLHQLVARREIDEVIVALPQTGMKRIREHVIECRKQKLPVKLVPQVSDALEGRISTQLVEFSVEDLLRRPHACGDISAIGAYLTGRRVLVTGAGGSIGSEMCRQIASLKPALLVLMGHGENSIHQIYNELQNSYPDLADRLRYAIGSVANVHRVNRIFEECLPHVVFHAAAHKHVPIMETNEQEAADNNVLGTYHIAEACGKFSVERVVLISTDKAADPCSVMGATKRVCEEVVRAQAQFWPQSCFVTVRFGNVLGSRGSVVPVIREQIARGGPVTVTHPDMTRYFMTIPEAVRLVLQAGGMGGSGELYLLEMGDPVRIVDLAEDMIRLSGFEPGADIQIRFTGIRPGEKLHERLSADSEKIESTPWEGISVVRRPNHFSPSQVLDTVSRLEHASKFGTAEEVRDILMDPLCRVIEEGTAAPEQAPERTSARV